MPRATRKSCEASAKQKTVETQRTREIHIKPDTHCGTVIPPLSLMPSPNDHSATLGVLAVILPVLHADADDVVDVVLGIGKSHLEGPVGKGFELRCNRD